MLVLSSRSVRGGGGRDRGGGSGEKEAEIRPSRSSCCEEERERALLCQGDAKFQIVLARRQPMP